LGERECNVTSTQLTASAFNWP